MKVHELKLQTTKVRWYLRHLRGISN